MTLRTDGSDGGAAFAKPHCQSTLGQQGMSMRDYFAAHAPEMTEQWWKDSNGQHWIAARAAWNYAYADAMLKARSGA